MSEPAMSIGGGLWIITAGAFVGQELAAEFGQIPPAFLPVGTRRLYEYQMERIARQRPVYTPTPYPKPRGFSGSGVNRVYITLPETYAVPDEDLRRLAELGAVALSVPEGISLGESVVFALNLIGGGDQAVWILHGDTLIDDMPPLAPDQIGIVHRSEGYSWAEVTLAGGRVVGIETVPAGGPMVGERPIACGYFAFASSTGLIRGITRARGGFIPGILDYATHHDLHAAEIGSWHDFGHVQTFFRSRRLVTSARHFNTLRIDGRTARKASRDRMKMHAEAAWLATVPPSVRIYAARLIDSGEEADGIAFYETEYGYLPTLAELFVFGTLGAAVWSHILQSCHEFLSACAAARTTDASDPLLRELVVAKTAARLRDFADATGFNVDGMLRYEGQLLPSLMQMAEDLAGQIDFGSARCAHVMHGDFCFSNILYDSRVQRVRVIDPRGYVRADEPSVAGDLRYDMAKFAHSVIGRYDQIIAGRYQLAPPDGGRYAITFEQAPHHAWLEKALDRFRVDGVHAGGREVRALTICLFLSMLPLHSDRPDRQRAFVANALRLYAHLEDDAV
jgi:hypothetical protein